MEEDCTNQERILLSRDNFQTDNTKIEEDETSLHLEDSSADTAFAKLPSPTQSYPLFQQISTEELLIAQQSDPFCRNIRQKLEEEMFQTASMTTD